MMFWGPTPGPRFITCYRCDVRWLGQEGPCWFCGRADRLKEDETDGGVAAAGVPPIC